MKHFPTLCTLLALVICQLPLISDSAERPTELNELRFEFHVGLAELEKNEPLQELNEKYRGYLEKQKAAYQKEGNLEAMMAVDGESKIFDENPGKELPPFPELKRLQGIYREQRKKLEAALNEKKLALMRSSEKKAKELSAKWTREGKIEEAKLALAESKHIAAMASDPGLAKTVPEATTEKSSTPSTPSRDDSPVTPETATKEKPFVNSLGMKFVPVPITGGASDGKLILFNIWETRVGDYEKFIRDDRDREWPKPDFPQKDDHPAVYVSWEDAVAFCEWLTEEDRKNRKIGKDQRYRLPTDHEWSCAVGIGKEEDPELLPSAKNQKLANVFPWGRDWPPPKGAGNYYGEETKKNPIPERPPIEGYEDPFDRTAPVGSFEPNEYGLYDLSGNAFEWSEDWYPGEQKKRVLRGSAWSYNYRDTLLSSGRYHGVPGFRGHHIGFRCVLGW